MDWVAAIFSAISNHLGITMRVTSVDTTSEPAGLESMTQTRPDAA